MITWLRQNLSTVHERMYDNLVASELVDKLQYPLLLFLSRLCVFRISDVPGVLCAKQVS